MASTPSLVAALAILSATLAAPAVASEGPLTPAVLQQALLPMNAIARETDFAYKIVRPETPSGRVMVLMHGSGGDETTLVALASRIAPDATLIGVRGRVVQDGVKRWYKRVTSTEFDQQDVRQEAEAFAGFIARIGRHLGIDLSGATYLGYSNGANLIAALSQLHPGLVRKAVLLRSMPVLDEVPPVDLSRTRFLTIAGENDKLYYPFSDRLAARLRDCGAAVEARVVPAGHMIGDEDARIAAEWLGNAEK